MKLTFLSSTLFFKLIKPLNIWNFILDFTGKMKPDETPMFDPSLLEEVDWSQNTATFSPAISPKNPGEGLVLRPLCTADLNKGIAPTLVCKTWLEIDAFFLSMMLT